MKLTFFFPEESGISAISFIEGQVPNEGQIIYIRNDEIDNSHGDRGLIIKNNKWKVKLVTYSLRTSAFKSSTLQESYEPFYTAEIHVVPYEIGE